MGKHLIPKKLSDNTYEVRLEVQMWTIKSYGEYLDEIYIPELGKRIRVIVSLADEPDSDRGNGVSGIGGG